ncbi:helix-turn-helix transcriptional regulator [Actinokineospora auranticolor]|uniref:Helix-turn-helix protein n=1 Tax=Actinokineospora auranticolor TaxID=155976 RepID=A0A2S6GHQ7_9PSEU|nr:helix-turn-helix transcriptional regulator [Actinokineospora auranticolor]PPK64764.1 helix-turn-helix protein [Actinokineospora auranticolor]
MPSVQTRRKRKLGRYLADLRDHAGLKPEAVAKLLRKSPSTVSRIENGHSRCDFSALTAMLGLYQATADQRQHAEELWEEAGQEAAPLEHSSAMPPRYRAFVKAWNEAISARTLHLLILPGPLQTVSYRSAFYRVLDRFIDSPIDVERDAASMELRRGRFAEPDPLSMAVLLDEAVIHRVVGGPVIMAEQLRHLVALGSAPNISIRVIPFGAGEYSVIPGAVTLLGFAEPAVDPDVVYVEYFGGGEWIEGARDVAKFAGALDDVQSLALSEKDTAALFSRKADQLESER